MRLAVPRPRLVAGSLSLALVAAALAPRLSAAGSPMDEGGLLAYADRILHGQLPLRDLHSFYGPLGTFVVAFAFKVAGPSLYAERAVGLAYRLVLAGALLGLVRRRGTPAIVAATVLLLWLLPPQGVAAYATFGGLAFLTLAILLADHRRALAAGVAAGIALLIRFDWAIAVVLAGIPYFVAWPRRLRARLLAGGAATVALYVPYLAVAGRSKLGVFLEGVRQGQAGRHLPVSFTPHGRGLLLDLTFLAIAVLLVEGFRRRRDDEGLAMLAVAGGAIGLLPYAFDRADHQHIVVAAIAPVVMLAAAVPAALGRRGAGVAAALVVVAAFAVGGTSTLVNLDVFSSSLGSGRDASTVAYGGRSFRIGSTYAAEASRAVRRAAAVAPPHGSLFVGPGDLNVTNYADAYIYFLLPQLRPATFYITLDPGATNLHGEHLLAQLARADVVVLNDDYDPPGRVTGAPHGFCLRGRYPPFRVYARCRASAAGSAM